MKDMKNYERIIELKVFNLQDVCELTGNINTARSLIRNLLLFNYIKRIIKLIVFFYLCVYNLIF